MSRFKRYWNKCIQYLRIIEILDDYWITQPDEAFVMVSMYFRHKNGEEQVKEIIWTNPNITKKERNLSDDIVCLADITEQKYSFVDQAREEAARFL